MSQVGKLVSLASFLATHPRITVEEAARATHRTARELIADMKTLLMVGVHPYSPSDFIGYAPMTAGMNSAITIHFADHFKRPLNFTPQEALALKYALGHFALAADAPTRRQVDALSGALAEMLHGRAAQELSSLGRGFVVSRPTERMRGLLSQLALAGEQRKIVEIEYYSAHRGEMSTRRVHPYRVVESGTHFYLFAFCELAAATRHFRVDRIRKATVTQNAFVSKPPKVPKSGRMTSTLSGKTVEYLTVMFTKEVASDVQDEWQGVPEAAISSARGGRVVLRLPLYNDPWAVGFAMGFGGHAEIVKPLRVREMLKRTQENALRAHGG